MAKIPILFSAKRLEIFDKIPIKEKSKTPSIRKADQVLSTLKAFSGTSAIGQTSDFSSSVAPVKTNGFSRLTCE